MAQLERRRSAQERYPSLCLRTPTRPSLEVRPFAVTTSTSLSL